MIILGKTGDDKGSQLEALTRDILSRMGCKNIQRNFVSSGGEEIDVTADYPLPTVGSIQFRRLICECKAHAKPIDLPPWLKFLGNIYSEEARLSSEVSGCFIALSGVNGNVSGHYDELRMKKTNIMLVKGDVLQDELKKLYDLRDVAEVNRSLARFTTRRYRTLELVYYDRAVYWMVVFEDDAYTILKADGNPGVAKLDVLKAMIEASLSVKPYVDLEEEAEAKRRAIQAKKLIISQLIKHNGQFKKSEIAPDKNFLFTEIELQEAMNALVADAWIFESTDKAELLFDEAEEAFYSRLATIYGFLFEGEPGFDVLGLLKSEFYARYLNEKLVVEIQRIQGNLPLSESDVELAVKMLKCSPSAVLWAVRPDPMIVNHRKGPKPDPDITDRFDRNYFFGQLYRSLNADLNSPIERSYLLDIFNIREIESTQKIAVKSSKGVEFEVDLNQRVGIGFLAEPWKGPDGSDTILMLTLDTAPEPWDVAAWKNKQKETEVGADPDPS
jgi:hypothetical protein